MTSIVVTGATGFIGRHLIPKLLEFGHQVTKADSQSGDIAEESTWLKFPHAEAVIHLAGKSFVPASWQQPLQFLRCNVLGTVAALDYCKSTNARLVFVSSYLYGKARTIPTPETAPLTAHNPYALSKMLAEDACRFYAKQFGLHVTILRPFNVYGPGQHEHFLIPSIVRQINIGDLIKVKDLEPRRDYIYVADFVEAIVKAVDLRAGFSVINIGSGVSHSVAELVRVIQDLKHTKLPVRSADERRKDEIMNTVADITLAQQLLGWRPTWTLSEGVRRTILEYVQVPG
jgi:GDP-4-dehydro-6-deoxy-D-mannose reductase